MVVDKLGTEKFSVNFCLLFVHGYLQRQSRMRVLAHAVCSCLQGRTPEADTSQRLAHNCTRLFAAVRGCSRLLTIFVIKFIFSQSQTPINDLSYVYSTI